MQYNERKEAILRLVADSAYVTSLEVSSMLGISRFNASMCLLKYHRFGLLRREKMPHEKRYYYNISYSGEKRLKWLQGIEEEEE